MVKYKSPIWAMRFQASLGYLRVSRAVLAIAVLIMNSFIISKLNSSNLHVSQNVAITEVLACISHACGVVGAIVVECTKKRLRFWQSMLIETVATVVFAFIAAKLYTTGARGCNRYADTPFGDVKDISGLPSVRDSC